MVVIIMEEPSVGKQVNNMISVNHSADIKNSIYIPNNSNQYNHQDVGVPIIDERSSLIRSSSDVVEEVEGQSLKNNVSKISGNNIGCENKCEKSFIRDDALTSQKPSIAFSIGDAHLKRETFDTFTTNKQSRNYVKQANNQMVLDGKSGSAFSLQNGENLNLSSSEIPCYDSQETGNIINSNSSVFSNDSKISDAAAVATTYPTSEIQQEHSYLSDFPILAQSKSKICESSNVNMESSQSSSIVPNLMNQTSYKRYADDEDIVNGSLTLKGRSNPPFQSFSPSNEYHFSSRDTKHRRSIMEQEEPIYRYPQNPTAVNNKCKDLNTTTSKSGNLLNN